MESYSPENEVWDPGCGFLEVAVAPEKMGAAPGFSVPGFLTAAGIGRNNLGCVFFPQTNMRPDKLVA